MDFQEILHDILDGFIIIGKILLCLIMFASMLIGVFSIVVIAAGKLPFSWWYVPCWIVILIIIAGAFGSASRNS